MNVVALESIASSPDRSRSGCRVQRVMMLKSLLKPGTALLLSALTVALVGCAIAYLHPLATADTLIRLNLWGHGVHSRTVNVGGERIHYFEALPAGGAPGTPLVLVHGLGSRGEDWAPLIPSLAAAGFHVYAPDLLGYGRSPRPDVSYSIALEESVVVGFMQTLQVNHADLGGWSMGGWVAAKLALDHPELVNRLILYDAAGIYFRPTYNTSLFVPTTPAGVDQLIAMLKPNAKTLPAFIARDALRRFQRNGWVVQRSVNRMLDGQDLLDFRLDALKTPTLIVWGAKDRLIPASVGQRMHQLIAGSSLDLIEGAGHLAPIDCPHSSLKATLDFLQPKTAPPAADRTFPCR